MCKSFANFKTDGQFSVADLPEPRRILSPGSIATRDMRPDRYNIILDDSGIVDNVYMG